MNVQAAQLRDRIDVLLCAADFDGLLDACRRELTEARKRQDREAEAMVLIGLAQAHRYLGKFYEARVYVDGALEFAQNTGADDVSVMALNASGALHLTASYNLDNAETDYRAALNLAYHIENQEGVVAALAGIAAVLNQSGDTARGMNYAREAFELGREIENPLLMASALGTMGNGFARAGKHEQALKAYQDALNISRENDIRLLEGPLLGQIGHLLTEDRRYYDEGIEMLERSLAMAQDIRSIPQEFTALHLLGTTRVRTEQYEKAEEIFETMLQQAQTWENRSYEAIVFYQLGRLYLYRENYDEALANFGQALIISRETMNPFQEAQTEAAMGLICVLKRDYDEALSHYMAARALYDALDDSPRTAEMMRAIVLTYINRFVDRVLRFLGLRRDETPSGDTESE